MHLMVVYRIGGMVKLTVMAGDVVMGSDLLYPSNELL